MRFYSYAVADQHGVVDVVKDAEEARCAAERTPSGNYRRVNPISAWVLRREIRRMRNYRDISDSVE